MSTKYKSKIGLELIVFLGATFGTIAFVIVSSGNYTPLFANFIILSGIGYTLWKTEYTIYATNLNIRCNSFVNKDIDISTIRKIKETYNPLSAPAASLDRLEIFYNKFDSVLISPKEKKKFIAHLMEINPTIEIHYRKKKS